MLNDKYVSSGEILGEGMSGLVRVYSNRETGEQVAVKTLNMENISTTRKSMLLSEVDIYRRLSSHPNIVQLIEIFTEDHKVHLVMEICRGGELYERLSERSFYDERTAAGLTRQMFSAVAYLHSINIVHRDLKLEHWLFADLPAPAPGSPSSSPAIGEIKLCDWGFASLVHAGTSLTATLGSALYVAPEVLSGKYGLECDEWSLGVIVYMLLSGSPPFDGTDDVEIMAKIATGQYSMQESGRWQRISPEACDFVRRLLVRDPAQRMTADQALRHVWLQRDNAQPLRISRSVVDRLHWHGHRICLVRAALGLLTTEVKTSADRLKLANALRTETAVSPGLFVQLLRQVRVDEDALAKFSALASGGGDVSIPVADIVQVCGGGVGVGSGAEGKLISRVHSVPSRATEMFVPAGWYASRLRGYYGREPVSNLVMGLVHGWSGFARKARTLELSALRVLEPAETMGAVFLLPNPKFHAEETLETLAEPGRQWERAASRFVVWWIAPEFVDDIRSWHEEDCHSPKETLGNPGDFGFSGERKNPDRYLNCYRDLSGPQGLAVLEGFRIICDEFLATRGFDCVGHSGRLSRGFHFPVRTQYSTLHMQIRVNSGTVVGADGRGVAFEDVAAKLRADPEIYRRDEEPLRFRVTDNIKANLLAAAAADRNS